MLNIETYKTENNKRDDISSRKMTVNTKETSEPHKNMEKLLENGKKIEGLPALVIESGDKEPVLKELHSSQVLPKTIGLLGGISFIVGTIIGSGIFVSVRGVAMNSGSVGMTLVVWATCGFISLLGAFCYVELGTVLPSSGADYSYLHAAFGPLVSFQFSWTYCLVSKPASQATLSLTFADYLITAFYGADCDQAPILAKKLLAVSLLWLLGSINILSTKLASKTQVLFTATKMLAVSIIIMGGVYMLSKGHTENLNRAFEDSETRIGVVLSAFYSCMWAYDGWNSANFLVEEMINFKRNLPLAILIGVPLVIFMYISVNISYFTVLSIPEVIDSDTVALAWAFKVLPNFSWVIPLFVAFSCVGACNGSIFSSGRVIATAAQNNHLPSVLSMIHVTRYTPISAILTTITLATLVVFIGTISELIELVGFLAWIFFGLVFLSVIIFRKKKPYSEVERPILIPMIVPLFCFLVSAALVLIPLFASFKWSYLFVILFVLVGYFIYFPFVYYKLKFPFSDTLSRNIQVLCCIFKPIRQIET